MKTNKVIQLLDTLSVDELLEVRNEINLRLNIIKLETSVYTDIACAIVKADELTIAKIAVLLSNLDEKIALQIVTMYNRNVGYTVTKTTYTIFMDFIRKNYPTVLLLIL